MKARRCLGIVVLVTLTTPAYAQIIGDTVNIEWDYPSLDTSIFSKNVTVKDPGVEVLNVGFGAGAINIGSGVITIENLTKGWAGSSGFNGFIFTDLSTHPAFTSFNLLSIEGFAPPIDPILSFNSDQLIVNFNASSVQNVAEDFGALYSFSYTTAIPEPETYAMLLVGLGLIGFVAYRKKQTV